MLILLQFLAKVVVLTAMPIRTMQSPEKVRERFFQVALPEKISEQSALTLALCVAGNVDILLAMDAEVPMAGRVG